MTQTSAPLQPFENLEFAPLRPWRQDYGKDLYVELEIHKDEDPDEVPCAALQIGEDESWIMWFGVYYDLRDFCFAQQHADNVVKGCERTRALWTVRVKRFSNHSTVYTTAGAKERAPA